MDNSKYLKWGKLAENPEIEVSNFGDCRTTSGFVYKPVFCSNGYGRYKIPINGKKKAIGIHTLVAKVFLPNPENKTEVNHKNGDPRNNCVWNLEWVTHEENMLHKIFVLGKGMDGENNPMYGMSGVKNPKFFDWVLAVDDNMNIKGRFPTQIAAATELLGKRSRACRINQVMNHVVEYKPLYGYWWIWEKEYEGLKKADLKPCELLEHPEIWIKHYRGQSAAKPNYNKYQEGSTTIESIG